MKIRADKNPGEKMPKRYSLISVALVAVVALLSGYYWGNWAGKNEGFLSAIAEENQRSQEHLRKSRLTIKSLVIENLPAVEYDDIFSKRHLMKEKIEDYEEFYQFCLKRFNSHKTRLTKKWQITDTKKLKGIFFMNLVSGLWGYSNKINQEKTPGCVLINETTGFREIPKEMVTIRTYLDSEIGCCTDYAHLLGFLLKKSGIKERLFHTRGHVVNEALFADGWHTLDATTNFLLYFPLSGIEDLYRRREKIRLTIFPHNNCILQNNPFYRTRIGQFRISYLLGLITKTIEYF